MSTHRLSDDVAILWQWTHHISFKTVAIPPSLLRCRRTFAKTFCEMTPSLLLHRIYFELARPFSVVDFNWKINLILCFKVHVLIPSILFTSRIESYAAICSTRYKHTLTLVVKTVFYILNETVMVFNVLVIEAFHSLIPRINRGLSFLSNK